MVSLLGFLFFCLLFTGGLIYSAKAEIEWNFDAATGTLTISGNGIIKDYSHFYNRKPEWYGYQNQIKTVIIEDGITSIGKEAFYRMSALETVIMSDSVTELHDDCFSDCDSLKNIEFSSNLQKVASSYGPFRYCDALESVCFPEIAYDFPGLASSIYNGFCMFDDCKSLKHVEFPKNWSTIPGLRACPSLEEILLPSNITRFTAFTFANSTIKEFTIPTSVKTLPRCLFYECSVGKLVIPQTVTYLESEKSYYTSEVYEWYHRPKDYRCEFYVVDGSTAYEWVKNRGYHYTLISPTLEEISVPSGKTCFIVNDPYGDPIKDALITYDDVSGRTNASGTVYLDESNTENPLISVVANAFETWSNEGTNWRKNSKGIIQITLYPTGTDGLQLSDAFYLPISEELSLPCDLRRLGKKLTIGTYENMINKPGSGQFRIECRAVKPSEAKLFELYQGDNLIDSSSDGVFDLNANQFEEGKNCKIRVKDLKGRQCDTMINLEFVKAKVIKQSRIMLKDSKFSIEVADDDIPLLGGSRFNFDLSFLDFPMYFVETETGIEVGINLNWEVESNESNADNKSPEKVIKEARTFLRRLKRAGMTTIGKLSDSQEKIFNSLAKSSNKVELFKKGICRVFGCGTYDIEKNTAEIEMAFSFKTGGEYSQTVWVAVVPVVISAKLDVAFSSDVDISYDYNNGTFDASWTLSPSAKISGFLGIGIGKFIGAGAYGSLGVTSTIEILPQMGIDTVDLTGELGIKAYVGWFEYEKAFAYNTWNLYKRKEVTAQSFLENLNRGQYDSLQYKLSNLSYLSEESKWMGLCENTVIEMSDPGKTSFQPLLTETYRNSQPKMVSDGNGVYASFLKADAETGNICTAITCFDGIEWREPVPVHENAIADSSPVMCVGDDGKIWLAYSQTNGRRGNTLQEFAQSQSIVVGWVDSETLSFHQTAEYTSQGYAHGQTMTIVDGKPVLVWIDSITVTDDDVLWPSENTIYSASCIDDGTWNTSGTALIQTHAPIVDLAIGEEKGSLKIGYFSDRDGSSTTKDDIDLYEIEDNCDVLLATNCTGSLQMDTTATSGEARFVWNEEDSLHFSDGTVVSAPGITREYVLLENCLFYSGDTDGKADIFLMYNCNGVWDRPVQMTDGGRYFENMSIAYLNGRYYALGMHTYPEIMEDNVTDHKNLVWAQIYSQHDIRLCDVGCETKMLNPGEPIEVTLFLENKGDNLVNSIYIAEMEESYPCLIQRGEKVELTIEIPCPEELTEYSFTVSEQGESDATPEDNTGTIKIGYSDLSIEAQLANDNGKLSIIVIVTNEGIQPTKGTVLFAGVDGNELAHADVTVLKAGESGFAKLNLDSTIMPGFDIDITISIISTEEDLTDTNNVVRIAESFNSIGGSCGTQASWQLTRDGRLGINGEGIIKPIMGNWPWQNYNNLIRIVVIGEGITSIQGSNAFNGCAMNEITLPETLIDCGTYTFGRCNGLTSFTMPPLVENIGAGMFYQCMNLEQVNLSESTTTIGNMAFSGCAKLKEVTGIKQVSSIGYSAFSKCIELTSFIIPTQMTCVPESLFSQCTNLKRVTLPANTISIERMAFEGCTNLEEIIGDEQVTSIGNSAFESCSNLDHFDFSENEVMIMDMAFIESGLSSIELKCGSIGDYAFEHCNALTDVVIGNGVKRVEYGSFSDCVSLNKVIFDGDETTLTYNSFRGSENVKFYCRNTSNAYTFARKNRIPYILTNEKLEAEFKIPDETKVLEEEAFASGGFKTVELNERLEIIQRKAFAECIEMLQIEIPTNVMFIADDAFENHNPQLIIFCEAGSKAHQFAIDQGIDFILMEGTYDNPET